MDIDYPIDVKQPHANKRGRKPDEPGRKGNPVICDAKNRRGKRCRALAIKGRTKCRFHGGKSLSGTAHPNYKHGMYSTDPLDGFAWACRMREIYEELVRTELGRARSEKGSSLSRAELESFYDKIPTSWRALMKRAELLL